MKMLPGPQDVLYAAPGNANYQYGPSMRQIAERMAALGANATSATFNINWDAGFNANPAAKAAFQNAVTIWSQIVTSPAGLPINIDAKFDTNLPSGVLGNAGPTRVCGAAGGPSDALYAAALANVKNNNASCADAGGFQITAHFNSGFGDCSSPSSQWDCGISGTPVTGKYNLMTVVLHEMAHGLGFYGSMDATGGTGSHFYDTHGAPGAVDIYDHFVVQTGAGGTPILNLSSPSAALGSALVGNNLFFSGTNANANNSGIAPKIESHDMTAQYGIASDGGFLLGSSYSHVDDVLYSPTGGSPSPNQFPNGLMTWALQFAEVYTDPGPITRGILADEGWTIQGGAGPCTFSISPTSVTVGASASSGSFTLTASASSCTWTASSNATFLTITSAATGTGSATVNYSVAANGTFNQRVGTLSVGGQTFTITQNGTGPTMTLDRSSLVFTGVNNGASFTSVTGSQTVRMTETGTPAISWTASSSAPWLVVSPTSGSGTATLTISTQFVGGLTATQVGTVTIALTGAGNTVGPINVTLNSISPAAAAPPFGSFDTPTNNATGIAGSIAVTGWALDDVQVTRVAICRDLVAGETTPTNPGQCAGAANVYIADAVFIDGARPDVQALFPTLPLSTRAGWGYLLLTNFLPNLGNSTVTLRAYAVDAEGHTVQLGSKTITCNNSASLAPFGAIDTPGQGAVVSGTMLNVGWVLAQTPNRADPPGGGTVTVFIDGTSRGVPGAWNTRSDLQALFPVAQYPGINTALGIFGFDTTTLTNGVHTIFWIATGSPGGGTSGIGSRFFTVSNGSVFADPTAAEAPASGAMVIAAASTLDIPRAAAARIASPASLETEVSAAPADFTAIQGRRGFDLDRALQTYVASGGRIDVQAEELDRIELHLSPTAHHQYSGYLHTAGGLRPLPVGSSLDPSTGAFTWMPGVGFYGAYDLTFVRWSNGRAAARQDVRITLNAKGSNRVGPQTIVDVPTSGTRAGSAFFVGGWAADLDSAVDTGVGAVHVWAYPIDPSGKAVDPIFVGSAFYGGARPDVGAVYGDRFSTSGYGMIVSGLVPGTYDIAVFAYSTVVNNFTPAKVVRVTVR